MAFAAVASIAPAARADTSQDKAVAEALFRDAKELLETGDVEAACPKFAESFKVDSTLGTLLFLAACHEQQGRTASAWSDFSSALSWAERAGQPERVAFARSHIAALERRLSFVVIHAPPIAGLHLKVDDAPLGAAAAGTPLPLDPGDHALEASAPDRVAWTTVIRVKPEPERIPVEVPDLPVAPQPPPPAGVPPVEASRPPAAPAPRAPAHGDTRRLVGLWSGLAVTAAGVAVGSVFGALTFQARDAARAACPGNLCQPGGLGDITRARTDATVSTIGFGVAGAAAIFAGYFLFKGDHARDSTRASAVLRTVTVEPSIAPHEEAFLVRVRARFE
jgi:hypothetical protein